MWLNADICAAPPRDDCTTKAAGNCTNWSVILIAETLR